MDASFVFAAVTESVITKRPIPAIARYFKLDPKELNNAIFNLNPFTFRGKLEAALENRADRPDLISTKTHLARLEEHYALLMLQYDRAESRCRYI